MKDRAKPILSDSPECARLPVWDRPINNCHMFPLALGRGSGEGIGKTAVIDWPVLGINGSPPRTVPCQDSLAAKILLGIGRGVGRGHVVGRVFRAGAVRVELRQRIFGNGNWKILADAQGGISLRHHRTGRLRGRAGMRLGIARIRPHPGRICSGCRRRPTAARGRIRNPAGPALSNVGHVADGDFIAELHRGFFFDSFPV